MNRFASSCVGTALVIGLLVAPPIAHAEDIVTYEVVSTVVGSAAVEYQTAGGRVFNPSVVLPWRFTVPVSEALGSPPDGSQVRADWRRSAGPARWVTVRVYYNGELICQNTLDVGNAACYGITRRIT